MIAIDMLRAGHGDALVVEYGPSSNPYQLLVDLGTVFAWEAVRKRLLERRDARYEVLVVTHLDEDHIGGVLSLLEDADLRHRIRQVWFNGYVHSKRGGNVLGPVHGERLTRAINDGGFLWNQPFADPISPVVGGPIVVPDGDGALPAVELPGGAKLHILSPSRVKLERMAKEWRKTIIAIGLLPGVGTDRKGGAFRSREKLIEPLPSELTMEHMATLAAPTKIDCSKANGSSVAFLLEYQGKRALLAGDAHPDVLINGLHRFGRMKGEARVRVDLCKLPHHGSHANVTTALIEAIDADRYLISTDGMNHGHPDNAAIARILCASGRSAQIYCNYSSERTRGWVKPAGSVGARIILPEEGATSMRVEIA